MSSVRMTAAGVVCLSALCLATGSVQAAVIWDLATDFSTTKTTTATGINGVWTFEGTTDDVATRFVYSSTQSSFHLDGDGDSTANSWAATSGPSGSGDFLNGIGKAEKDNPIVDTTPSFASPNNTDILAGEIITHQDSTGDSVYVTWTAPTDTRVNVSGLVWGANGPSASREMEFDVLHTDASDALLATINSTTAYLSNDGRGAGDAISATNLSVTAGDKLVVRMASNHSIHGALSGLDLTIYAVPEPSSLALSTLVALVGLAFLSVRSRSCSS